MNMKKKVFSMLALLVAATTGAWAQEPDPINLTYDAQTDKWTLASMPAYDVELEVEYYDEVTLTDGEAIVEAANAAADRMTVIFKRLVEQL